MAIDPSAKASPETLARLAADCRLKAAWLELHARRFSGTQEGALAAVEARYSREMEKSFRTQQE